MKYKENDKLILLNDLYPGYNTCKRGTMVRYKRHSQYGDKLIVEDEKGDLHSIEDYEVELFKGKIMEKVNHPSHYNSGKYEAIDVIEDWNLDFHLGNAIKYIARAEHKGNFKEDLNKAIWYLERKLNK